MAAHSPIDVEADIEDDTKLEDTYVDAGELDLSNAHDNLYLTRMPKFTWQALQSLKNDDEIQVGTLRVQGDRQNPDKVSLMLDPSMSAFRLVPREYNMRMMNRDTPNANTFIFTERDLPGFKRKSTTSGATQAQNKAHPGDRKDISRIRDFRFANYRKGIPKKTALIGQVKQEYNCLPVENKDYVDILSRRHAEKPQDLTAPKLVRDRQMIGNVANPGGVGGDSFVGFIRGTPQREKKQQQKAARMPRNELLDVLFTAFREYKYWYFKDLRLRTRQPESYLKETLESIAELVRQGNQANTWRLQQGSIADANMDTSAFENAPEAVAPAADEPDTLSQDEDDDDNMKMEDVI